MGNQVFICYAREDEHFVLTLARHLKAHEVPVWLDHWDIPAGANWQRSIDKAIQDCAKFLIVLSPAAVDSEEVEGELRTALDEHKLVVPVLHKVCRIPLRLRSRQYVDFTIDQSPDNTLSQLVRDLGGSQADIGKPPPPIPDEVPPWWSTGRNVFWIVTILLSLLIGVWLFLPILRHQRETKDERAKTPESKYTAPQPPPIAASPQASVEETTKSKDTKVVKDEKDMVAVPAGKFLMGCKEEDTGCDNNVEGRSLQKVNVSAFSIDRTEVTVADYRQCVEAKGCTPPDTDKVPDTMGVCNWEESGRENHPINCVNWNQANAFCKWAGKRLPTKEEWEKAARGTDGRIYPWGDKEYREAGKVANIADETLKTRKGAKSIVEGYDDGFVDTAPVGSFAAGQSPYGALDMIGNVDEWTASRWGGEERWHSTRGGSWVSHPLFDRASRYEWTGDSSSHTSLGFRCAH